MSISRIIFIAVGLILIPTVFLAILGLRSIEREGRLIEQKIEEKYKSLADIVVSQFKKEINNIGIEVLDRINKAAAASDSTSQLIKLEKSEKFVRKIFVFKALERTLLYPSSEDAFYREAEQLVVPQILKGSGLSQEYVFNHIFLYGEDQPKLFVYTKALAQDIIAGFLMDNSAVTNLLLEQTDIFRDTVRITRFDGKPLGVEEGVLSRVQSPAPRNAPLFSDIIEGLPFWRISVYERSPEVRERFLARRVSLRIYISMIFLLFLAVFSGGWLTLRVINFEFNLIKLKSDFVATVSHELKTPLTSIRMFAETLCSGKVCDERAKQLYYETIAAESQRLTYMAENILNFSAIEEGKKKYNFDYSDINQVVKEAVEIFQSRFLKNAGRDAAINTFLFSGRELAAVLIDKAAIQHALFNLLFNAVQYSVVDPQIDVSVDKRNSSAVISIKDKGVGIPKREQKKIFNKFYRVKQKVSFPSPAVSCLRADCGSGFGLTLVKHIVYAHKGKVEVQSREGEGSTFSIVLPV